MATPSLPEPPTQLKAIQSYMKIAQDVERVDPIVSYWLRLFSTESALKIDRDSPECKTFLSALIMWLEKFKSTHKDSETVTNQIVGQAHFENFTMSLFNKADTQDREGTADKVTVRMFFMAAILFEAMAVFGSLTDEIAQRAKYAKFKAAYIQKCLKTGQTPKPGPVDGSDLEGKGETSESTSEQPSNTFDIPEVPKDSDKDVPQQKPLDPFILNPSSPPSSMRPSMPPSLPPGVGYSKPPTTQLNPAETTQVSNDSTASLKEPPRSTISDTRFFATNGSPLDPQDIIQSQKYCKFATSALQYDDVTTAVDNLQKALKLLTTGQK